MSFLAKRSPSDTFVLGAGVSFVRTRLILSVGESSTKAVDSLLSDDLVLAELSRFFSADGPKRLLFFYQVRAAQSLASSSMVEGAEGVDGSVEEEEPELFVPDLEKDHLMGKCIYFLRECNRDVASETVDTDLSSGELSAPLFETMDLVLSELHTPYLKESYEWGRINVDSKESFLMVLGQLREHVQEAVSGIQGGTQLCSLNPDILNDPRAGAWNKMALDDNVMNYIESVLEEWIKQVDALLKANDLELAGEKEGTGPATELSWWRKRMAKLAGVVEQLKGREAKAVFGLANAGKSRLMRKWKSVDGQLTDLLNEAKDNVKYLSSLDHFIEPLYSGTIAQIKDSLPGLFTNLKMMVSIARYYSTADRITRLLRKIANQIIAGCRRCITRKGPAMGQDPGELVENTRVCIGICKDFQEHCQQLKEKLGQVSKGNAKQVEFEPKQVFPNIERFVDRMTNVVDLINTSMQFSTLYQAEVEGMEGIISRFEGIMHDIRMKPYDFFDYTNDAFDHDFAYLNKQIGELEYSLKAFIDVSFDDMQSTETALALLGKLEAILQRESLKQDLADKYALIFEHYGEELEEVQDQYDRQKLVPPTTRNAPPVAGNIMWARQLLTRVEEPMQRFLSNKAILSGKESRSIVRKYNKVAMTLTTFEAMWYQAWCKSIDSSRAGLNATLIVRHPESPDELVVNFDPEVMQLLRETKALHRLGIELPDSAKMILMQENKFKTNFERMRHHLDEYNRLLQRFSPIMKRLMGPHLEEFERIIRPGMVALTWLSMNIDAYLHKIQTTLHRLNSLTTKVLGVTEFRIERNLKVISRMLLVDLPSDVRFTLDEYVSRQEADVKAKTQKLLEARNEVENAMTEIVEVLRTFRTENDETIIIPSDVVEDFNEHYSHHFYLAILNAVKRSFAAIKRRLGSRQKGGFLFVERPFFDVDVELTIPNVTMHPSLDDVQNAISESAKLVLSSAKSVPILGNDQESYHSLIAKDMQVVQSVLLLTGSVEGSKRQVLEYLETYRRYEFLWTADKNTGYNKFVASNPDLDDFEAELSKYQDIESEIQSITPVHVVGCMSLRTQSLKYSLKAETAAWKSQYANNLHGKAKKELDGMIEYFQETNDKLSMDVQNVDEVGEMVAHLSQLRSREADLELQIVPVETMYYILAKYDVRIPKDETKTLAEIRPMWRGLMTLGQEKSGKLTQLQSAFKKELIKTVKGFALECNQFCNEFDMHGPMVAGLGPAEALERLTKFEGLCQEVEAKVKDFHDRETLFGLNKTQYTELSRVRRELDTINLLYSLYSRTEAAIAKFSEFLWVSVAVNMKKMSDSITEFQSELMALPRILRDWVAYKELRQTLHDFQQVLPVLSSISGPAMRTRHWNSIMQTTGKKLNLHADHLRLRHILAIDPVQYRAEIEEVCTAAIKEAELEIKVRELAELWNDLVFTFANYKDRGPVTLDAKSLADIMEKLEESLATLAAITSNRYAKPLEEEVVGWVTKLSGVAEIVEHWNHVQTMWVNVEAVFSLSDISAQLGGEARRFQKVDAAYMKLMGKAAEHPNIIDCCYSDNQLRNLLPHLAGQLELCQKSLAGYLDKKREAFSRFYFVSDRALLEILSEGIAAPGIEHHMAAMFEGLRFLTVAREGADGAKLDTDSYGSIVGSRDAAAFNSGNDMKSIMGAQDGKWGGSQASENVMLGPKLVFAVNSRRGASTEKLELTTPVEVTDVMESLFGATLAGSKATLRDVFRQSLPPPDTQVVYADLIRNFPLQVAVLACQVLWTKECHDALHRARAEKNIMLFCNKHQAVVLAELLQLAHQELAPAHRLSVETLVALQIYQREAFDELVQKRAFVPTDFDWVRHTRFYWLAANSGPQDDRLSVCIADMDSNYTWEYMGLKERLVCTALTARCFVAISQAVGMCLGTAIVGPTGMGKTETVRDLGRGYGRFVATINCTWQMDLKSLEKVFKGLAASGSWGCFDDFGRVEPKILSECSQHINCVLTAMREARNKFTFTDGETITLDKGCCICVTMAPPDADSNSQGLAMAAGSLRVMFRPFSMIHCDTLTILQIRLLAHGFENAPALAKKLLTFYTVCQEQLSRLGHYDFGLRNVTAVLHGLAVTKKEEPGLSEQGVLYNTIKRINMPRLMAVDIPPFVSLLGDLLPEAVGASTAPKLIIEEIIRKQVWEDSLDGCPAWIEKMLQFNQVANTHHAVMLTGPCGSGKSAIVGTLCRALTAMDSASKHAVQRMNPKAISTDQMYGWVDTVSGEWHDGVFVSLWRSKASKQAAGQHAWIVLDGPIDSVWIESLNSALDEQRTLTLANGDKIPMSGSMHLVFENDSLAHVSPSAVSRSGVVALDQNTLGWRSLIKSWLETRGEERAVLSSLFDRYMDSLISFTTSSSTPALDVSVSAIPRMVTALYESVGREIRPENLSGVFLEKIFIFCVAWGVGGRLDNADRIKFTIFLRTITELLPPTTDSESLFDFFPDDKTADWQPWSSCVGQWEFPPLFGETIFHDLQLPTPDSWRTEFLIRMFASSGTCVLVTGPPGCGKSMSIRRYTRGLDPDHHTNSSMCLSGTTLPRSMIASIEDVVEKRQGRTYAPAGGKRCTFLFEDIAQPHVDSFGDQACLEFLRQLLADGGYYATNSTEFNTVQGMQFICEMIQPSVSGKDLPPRLKGRMLSLHSSMPRDAVVASIFSRMLHGKFKRYQAPRPLVDLVNPLCDITVETWHRCATRYPSTPTHPHLQFTLHDVARVFQGILRPAVSTMPDAEYLISLWKWELQRSFMDKLTTPEDIWNCWDGVVFAMKERIHLHLPSYCYDMMGTAPQKRREPPAQLNSLQRLPSRKSNGDNADSSGPKLFFTDAVKGDAKPGYRLMEMAEVMEFADEARKNSSVGNVVLFDDAISHVMRIARVLGAQRGCMLIVGDGGAGRRPLSRMAAVLAGSRYLEWQSTDAQSRARTMELVKDAYRLAGVRGVSVTLVLDNERSDTQTLEMLNQFVSTGEFPGLLSKDDLDMVLEEMRSAASLTEAGPSNPTLGGKSGNDAYARFVTRARSCFHVILTFSPGERLVECMRGYAGITRRCTVDWFMPWGHEIASNVAITLMQNNTEFTTIEPSRLAECMAATHCLVQDFVPTHMRMTQRHVYITPGTFLSFADTYQAVYVKHSQEIRRKIHMMSGGLKRLHGARTGASEMQEDLQQKDSVLAQAQVSAGELLKEITDSTMKAEKKKGEVTIVKNQLSEQATLIQQDRDDCERDLETAKPSLIAAETALQSINQKDILALKTMKNPPAIVRMILDAMLILLHKQIRPVEVVEGGSYRDSFEFATQAMNDPTFVDSLMNFPKGALTGEDVELLAPYLSHKDFQPDKVRAQSAMAANLCSWVRAICQYQEIARLVFPKQEKLVMAEAQLAIAHRQLQKAVDELAKCQEDLDVMQQRFEVAMGEKQRLSDDSRNTMSKIDAANRLILALGGENDRWVKQVRDCEEELIRLPGDCVLAATFMDYLGPFSQDYRAEILKGIAAKCDELRIHVSTAPDIHRFFTTHAEIRKWTACGLPPDESSVQNATLTMHSGRWPIIIDPQNQAVAWIKRLAGDTISFADINAMVDGVRLGEKTLLEDCLVSGRQLVLTNVLEEMDPILDNLVSKTLTNTGKRFSLHLGGRDIEFTPSFRLLLATHLPNPNISPFVASQTSLVDFSISMKGLEHQLLNLVISIDKNEVYKQKVQVDAVVDEHKNVIEELNSSLLERLSDEDGNLLDDEALMTELSNTKSSLDGEMSALKEASESQELVSQQFEEYRPVALRGALLFFAAEQMNKLGALYYVSLNYYIGLFSEAVANTEHLMSRQSHIPAVTASITRAVMDFCRRVYFCVHRDVFRLMVSLKVLQHEKGTVTSDHLYCLSKGGMHVLLSQCPRKPKDWLTDTTYANLIALSERVPKLHNIIDTFCRKEPWRHWIEKDKPEEEPCPDADLPMILRLLIIRAMREDRLVQTARLLIIQTIGEEHAEGHADLDEVLAASTSTTPIICISEPGNDATTSVLSIARRKHKRITQIALGQDRAGDLWRVVHGEMEVGGWVVLQNAHLAVPAVNALEKKLIEASHGEAGMTRHASFRLWITTQEATDMSVGLLLMSMRVSCEAPEGIRAGMLQLYSEMVDQDLIDSMDASKDWSRLIYTMAYLHCIIKQRLRYSVMGWSADESLTGCQVADWQTCISYLRDHMIDKNVKEIKRSTWLGIRYMTSEIQFGGGFLDEWDERIMMTYTDRFFAEDAMVHPNEWFAGVQRPDSAQIGDHLETIKAIKKDDTPDMVGLGPAGDNVHQVRNGRLIIDALCTLETRSISSNRHFPPETLADDAAGVAASKLPRGWSADYINAQAHKLGATNPLILFLRQEAEQMNKLVAFAKSSLKDLRGALSGAAVITPAMQTMMQELSRARVPTAFSKMSFPAPTLASWLNGLHQRYETLDKWMGSTARPKSFWLGGFFKPQVFIMALKQDACRRHAGWTLEDLKINSEVFVKDSDAHKPGDDTVSITGLSLEGAAWMPKTDRGGEGKLTNSPAKVLFNEFPKLQVIMLQGTKANIAEGRTPMGEPRPSDLRRLEGPYVCPVYTNPQRGKQNFVMTVSLKTDDSPHKWILRGTAIICARDGLA